MGEQVRFFKKAHFFWICSITAGMTLLGMCHYSPQAVPHHDLRPIGLLTQYLCENHSTLLAVTWYSALAAHVGEAFYALSIAKQCVSDVIFNIHFCLFCRTSVQARQSSRTKRSKLTVNSQNIEGMYCCGWFVQTLLFGYASLHHLLAFRKKQTKTE